MKLMVIFFTLFLILACEGKSITPEVKTEQKAPAKVIVEKEKMEKEDYIPPEVKIKLKRDGKDNYSWEISGSDADQILKVNEKFKKRLGGEQNR
jgi:hypothetical protein